MNEKEVALNELGSSISSKREAEIQRINQLRQRLDAAKQGAKERPKELEGDGLFKSCREMLREAEEIANQVEESLRRDKKEMQIFEKELQELVQSNIQRTEELELQLSNSFSKNGQGEEKDLVAQLEAEREKSTALEEERDLYKELASTLQEEKDLRTKDESTTNISLSDEQQDSDTTTTTAHDDSILISHIQYLQRTFESDETLARALYSNLAADAIPNPNRCGYLTKQGGTVKSWKRRYFVLKDNFLFYYKRPRDDSPTGVIQLEHCTVVETPSEESDRKNCFTLRTPSRTWFFQADRQIEMDIWIDCISHAENWWTKESPSHAGVRTPDQLADHLKKTNTSRFRFSSYITSTPSSLTRIKGRTDTDY